MNIRNKDLENFKVSKTIPKEYKELFIELQEEHRYFSYNFSNYIVYLYENNLIKIYEIYNLCSYYNSFVSFCRRTEVEDFKVFENIVKTLRDPDFNEEILAYYSNKENKEYYSNLSQYEIKELNDEEKKLIKDIDKYFKSEKFKKTKKKWDFVKKCLYSIANFLVKKFNNEQLDKNLFNFCNGVVSYKREEKMKETIRLKQNAEDNTKQTKIEEKKEFKELSHQKEIKEVQHSKELNEKNKPLINEETKIVFDEENKKLKEEIEKLKKKYEDKILVRLSYENEYKQKIKKLNEENKELKKEINELKERANYKEECIKKLENRYNKKDTDERRKKFIDIVEKLKINFSKELKQFIKQNNINEPKNNYTKNIINWMYENREILKNYEDFKNMNFYCYNGFLKFNKKLKNNENK